MDKQEFFDKIDKIWGMVDSVGADIPEGVNDILSLLDEIKADAEHLFDDEYELGVNRGWNHSDGDGF